MKLFYTERFRQGYESAPPHIQRAFDRRAALLVQNLRHPSLRAKKYDTDSDRLKQHEGAGPDPDRGDSDGPTRHGGAEIGGQAR